MEESKEELKSLLIRMIEESEKAGLKLNVQKTKIMASNLITSWQVEGEKLEAVTDFIFLGSKITTDGDCSHEIKRRLLLGRKGMTNLDSIFKSRDITLPTKVCLVKAMVFPVVMPKNWCFWTVVLETTLESPLDCKEIQAVHPKGKTDAEAETPIHGHLMWRTDLLEKTLMLGEIEGRRRKGRQRMRWLDGITNSIHMGLVNSMSWW